MSDLQISTIGHSNHSLSGFLDRLLQHRVACVVDIRRNPTSRRYPHFSRENLSVALEDEGIEYHWLEALGGNRQRSKFATPSPNRGIDDESIRNFADYMDSDEFRQGVTKLLENVGRHRTAMVCAEGDYRRCHRRLLGDYLMANDVTVQHILPDGEVKPHALTPGAKVVDGTVTYPGQPTLFDM